MFGNVHANLAFTLYEMLYTSDNFGHGVVAKKKVKGLRPCGTAKLFYFPSVTTEFWKIMQYCVAAGPAQRPWHGGSDTVTPLSTILLNITIKQHLNCLITAEVMLNTNLETSFI